MIKKLITHAGVFHADEVFATVILRKLFPEAELIRTFTPPENPGDDTIVYDIGLGKFDHHQADRSVRKNGVPYAACGLIWAEFGYDLCEQTDDPDYVWNSIEFGLVQGIDAVDNGVGKPHIDHPEGYRDIGACSLDTIIKGFNPTWDSDRDEETCFWQAVAMAESIFDNAFANTVSAAKAQVAADEMLAQAKDHIMILDHYIPWQRAIFNPVDGLWEVADSIFVVVYPGQRGGWNWQLVPVEQGSLETRIKTPEEWCGAPAEELQKQFATATFVHNSGFLGNCKDKVDAIKMAQTMIRRAKGLNR